VEGPCRRLPGPPRGVLPVTRRLLDACAQHLSGPAHGRTADSGPRVRSLAEREREILVAIGRGWTNGEIAERLVLSESTVKTHVGRVLSKIGARDRVQAVILACDLGLTRPRQPHLTPGPADPGSRAATRKASTRHGRLIQASRPTSPPSAVSRQPSAVSRQPSAVSRQPSAVSRQREREPASGWAGGDSERLNGDPSLCTPSLRPPPAIVTEVTAIQLINLVP
jgi:DNA-binding CsgD family transcriptional regulator